MHREIQHNPEVPNTNITYKTLCVLDIFVWQIHFNNTYKLSFLHIAPFGNFKEQVFRPHFLGKAKYKFD